MSCTEFQSALSELVDGTLPRDRRSHVEAHVESCADCRTLLADIRRMRERARALPKMMPPAELWDKVRGDFDRQAGLLRQGSGAQGRLPHQEAGRLPHQERTLSFVPRRHSVLAGLAAAAVLVLATATGVYYMTRRPAPAQPVASNPANAQPAATVTSIEAELSLADQHYSNAIAALEKVAQEGQGALDPKTAAVLAKSNAILDQAINESRAALRTQPTSEVARASLFEALQRKVALLRDTVTLINEMRKGDAAGTARVVGGLGKS
jgi:anti-sigma factor RsiW